MLSLELSIILSLILSRHFSMAQYWLTTHSPLTAFKQLGFDEGNHPQSSSYIPQIIKISDYHKSDSAVSQQQPSKQTSSSTGLTQIRHPNDILSNMGVDLPSQEILGKNTFFFSIVFADIHLENCL